MKATEYQPPLTWWSHTWRLVLVLGISAAAWSGLAAWQWEHDRPWFFLDLVIGAITLVLVWWRRSHPFGVAMITGALAAVSGTAGGPATLALVSLSTTRRWRQIIPAAIVNLLGGLAIEVVNPTETELPGVVVVALVAIIGVAVGWGLYIGSRRELLATLRERADTAEAEQAIRVSQARVAERTRIAREMHDVLAHRISLVTMHAGALSYRDDLSPDQVRATAEVIQQNSHQALVDLREVLGILRDEPGDADPELPQPSAVDLRTLVAEARRSGMRVDNQHAIALDGMPEGVGRTVYRIVQEALTNARKHAPDTRVVVNLFGGPGDGLEVEVRNPLQVGSTHLDLPVSGLGLIGLQERAVLAGGRLTHRVTPEQEFVLHAWLPWPA